MTNNKKPKEIIPKIEYIHPGFRLIADDLVLDLETHICLSIDDKNYQRWLTLGNKPDTSMLEVASNSSSFLLLRSDDELVTKKKNKHSVEKETKRLLKHIEKENLSTNEKLEALVDLVLQLTKVCFDDSIDTLH